MQDTKEVSILHLFPEADLLYGRDPLLNIHFENSLAPVVDYHRFILSLFFMFVNTVKKANWTNYEGPCYLLLCRSVPAQSSSKFWDLFHIPNTL